MDLMHGFLEAFFQAGVHGGGGFIQDEDLRILQDGAGNGQELFLALGDVVGFLVDEGIVALA